MSADAKARPFWKKETLRPPREIVYVLGLSLCVVAYFKCVPYFSDNSEVNVFIRETDKKAKQDAELKIPESVSVSTASSGGPGSRFGRSGGYGDNSTSRRNSPRILERPLFDGKSVTLQVRLTNALDSSSGDSSIEGRIIGVVDSEQPGTVDTSIVMNGVIRGSATPNFDSRRYGAQFNEILNTEGKSIPVSAVAYSPGDASLGIQSEYASGLASRLAGSAINRVIVAADAVAESHILDDGSTSAVDRELNRVAQQGSSEAANGLGDVASKGLRETKAVLRVPAGTVIFVKMQASKSAGGLR